MRINVPARSFTALVASIAGCVDGAGVRQHDTMYAAISRAEPDHPRAIDDAALVVDGELDRGAIVAAVLERNPDLEVARATWRAAVAAYPSAVALEDPMASYSIAPFSIDSGVPFGTSTSRCARSLPWPRPTPAPRRRRERRCRSRAGRPRIASTPTFAEAAVHAFDDDYIAARALEINQHHLELLERIEQSAVRAVHDGARVTARPPRGSRTHHRARARALDARERPARRGRQSALNRLLRPQGDRRPGGRRRPRT